MIQIDIKRRESFDEGLSKMILHLIVLGLLGCLASAGPIVWDDSKCSQYCSEGSTKYQFTPGTSFLYSYKSENELQAERTPELVTKLEAKVKITVVSKCEMVLELSSIESDSDEFTHQLERNPLPFAWDDGKIVHVCPHPLDSDEVLNIKKAILSSIQNTMRSFDMSTHNIDLDIFGICDVSYNTTVASAGKYQILKTINVPSCSNHLQGQTPLLISLYQSSSHQQHLPLLSDEKATCEQIIDKGLIKEVQCYEEAYFKPLFDYGYVIKATGRSTLKIVSVFSATAPTYKATKKERLVFKYQPHSQKSPHAEKEIENVLRHICTNSEKIISKEVASYTHKLVYIIRQMDAASIERIYDRLKNNDLCNTGKKALTIYMDALRLASSGGSIALLSKLATSKQLSETFATFWVTMMPFTSYVEEESISSLIPLLRKGVADTQTLLGTTALAYKYCSINPDCESTDTIKDFSTALKEILGDKCTTKSQDEETKVITALKAFGNLGYFGERASDLFDCALTTTNKMAVRIAAIDAFRRSPCKDDTTSKLLEIYSNKYEHDELRIAALMPVAKCASKAIMQNILDVYFSETSKQVEVFTWSLLENIRTSQDPSKAVLRKYLGLIDLSIYKMKKPKSTDATKFSRNFDLSYFTSLFNLGVAREANLIHSADSFIPRSGNIVHKLNVFGHHVETLEIGARMEGLEHTLEKLFGPVSNIQFSNINFDELIKQIEWIKEIPVSLNRSRRSAESYRAQVNALSEKIEYQRNKVSHGTAFLRIMGHELGLLHLNEESLKRFIAEIKDGDMFKNLANLNEIDTSQNLWFIDFVILSPSITGRAYKLASNHSVTLGISAQGKIDIKTNSPIPDVDIDGKFQPSILSEMSTSFTIHGDSYYEPGIQVETILNGGSDYKVNLKLEGGRLMHLRLNQEQKRNEIVNLKQKFYYMSTGGKSEMQKPPSQNLNYCTELLQKLTGAQICASLTYSQAFDEGKFMLPFAREFEASIVAEQTDISMDGYELLLEVPDFGNTKERRFKFLADTPNSLQDRKFSVDFHSEMPDANSHSLTANLHTPFYTLDATGYVMNKEDYFRLSTDITADGERRYSFNVDAPKRVKRDHQLEYQPVITLSSPSLTSVELRGSIVYSNGRKEHLLFKLHSKSLAEPLNITGNIEKEGEAIDFNSNWKLKYEFNIRALNQIHRLHAGFGYDVTTGMFFDCAHYYEPDGRSSESVAFNARVKNIKLYEVLSFSLDTHMLFAEHKNLNTMLKWDFSFKPLHHLKNNVVVRYGENFNDDTHRVQLTFESTLHGDLNNLRKLNVENKAGIIFPYLNIDRSVSVLVVWDFVDEPKFIIKAGIKCEKDVNIKIDLSHRQLEKSPLKRESNFAFTYNTYNFHYEDKTVESSPKTFKWISTIKPYKDNEIVTEIVIDPQYKVVGKIQIPDFNSGGRFKRQISFNGKVTPGDTNTIELSAKWGNEKHEEITISVTSSTKNDKGVNNYIIGGHVKYDVMPIIISGSVNADLMKGPHLVRLAISEEGTSRGIEITHAITGGEMTTVTRYLVGGNDRIKQEITGRLIYREKSYLEIQGSYTLISLKRMRFNDTSLSFRLFANSNVNATQIRAQYDIKIPTVTEHKGKFIYDRKKGWPGTIKSGLDVSVYKKKLYGGNIRFEPGTGKYFCKVNLAPTEDIKFNLFTAFVHAPRFAMLNLSLDTNLPILQTVDLTGVVDLKNMEDAKIESHLDVNSHKIYATKSTFKILSITNFGIEANIDSKIAPSLHMSSKAQGTGPEQKFDCKLNIGTKDIITGSGEFKRKSAEVLEFSSMFKYKKEQILILKIVQNVKSIHEQRYYIKSTFPSEVYTLFFKVNKEKAGIVNYDTKFCGNNVHCIRVIATNKEYNNTKEWDITYKRDDVEFSVENIRESSKSVERYHTVIYKGDKRFGCDVRFGVEGPGKSTSLGIILPTREIIIKGTTDFSATKSNIKLDFSTDGRNHPERKLSIDAKFENPLMYSGLSKLELTIAHPTFEKPINIKLSYNLDRFSAKYLTAEGSLDYSMDPADKIIAKLSVEDFSRGSNMIILNIYHKDDQNLDLVVKVNSTFVPSENTVAVKYKWIYENGAYTENDIILSHLKTENRVHFTFHKPNLNYKLDGKIKPPDSLLNNTYEVDFDSVYDGPSTKGKLVLDYDTGCYKVIVTDNEGEISRIVELCVNFYSRKLLSLLSEGTDDKGERTLQYLLDIVKKNETYIGFRQQINPEFYNSRSSELTSIADKLDGKLKTFLRNFNSKVSGPFSQFFIAEAKQFTNDIEVADAIFKQAVEHYYNNMPSYEAVKEYLTKVKHRIEKIEKEIWDTIFSYYNETCQNDNECNVLLKSYEEGDWKSVLSALWNFLQSLPDKMQQHLTNRSKEVGNNFSSKLNDVLDWCGNLMIEVLQSSKKFFQPVIHATETLVPRYYNLAEQKITTNEFIQTSVKLLEKGSLMVKKAIESSADKIITYLRAHVKDYWSKTSSSSKRIVVHQNDTQKGLVDVDIHDGMISNSLYLLSMMVNSLLSVQKTAAESYLSYNRSILTKFKRIVDLDFIPPYDAQATILAGQHFITFDKAFYDFAGECSYLLARDFEDGNFTVVLKSNGGEEPASVLVLKGDTGVEISSGRASVKVADAAVQLPCLNQHISVTREGNTIVVSTKNGFQVKCNLIHEICTFRMSGWYYGKTAGLLGTYNYEEHDEFERPTGIVAINSDYSKKWELGNSCKTPNFDVERRTQIDENSDYFKICKIRFGLQSSPLSACFEEVPPEKYFYLCVRYLKMERDHEKALCNVEAAYVAECEKNYVEINLPSECIKCDAPDASILEHGERRKFEKLNQKSVDTVFIIEDHECNKVLTRDLHDFARSIERELQKEGFRENMFGVVAFGGDIGNPQVFTAKDKIFFNSGDVAGISDMLKLESKKSDVSKAFEAIMHAVTHLSRSANVKSFILLSCSACKNEYTWIQYPVIQQMLLERGITLHVIKDYEIPILKSSVKDKNIIGVDPDTVYYSEDVTQKELVGEPDLRHQVIMPKDFCVALSQDVNGTFFSSHPISKASPIEIKNFKNVFSRKFSKSIQLFSCQWCECTSTRDHSPNTVCQPCEIKRPRLPFFIGSSVSAQRRTLEAFISYLFHMVDPNVKPVY